MWKRGRRKGKGERELGRNYRERGRERRVGGSEVCVGRKEMDGKKEGAGRDGWGTEMFIVGRNIMFIDSDTLPHET